MQSYTEFLKAAGKKDMSTGDRALYVGAMGAGALAGLPQYRQIVSHRIYKPSSVKPGSAGVIDLVGTEFFADRRLLDFTKRLYTAGRVVPNSPKFQRRAEAVTEKGLRSSGRKRFGAGLGLSLAGAYAGKKAVDFLRSKKYKD